VVTCPTRAPPPFESRWILRGATDRRTLSSSGFAWRSSAFTAPADAFEHSQAEEEDRGKVRATVTSWVSLVPTLHRERLLALKNSRKAKTGFAAVVSCLLMAAGALAASPTPGARYTAGIRGLHESATVSAQGKAFTHYSFRVRVKCSNGKPGQLGFTKSGLPVIPIHRGKINFRAHAKGTFAMKRQSIAGTYRTHLKGHFVSSTAVELRLRITFSSSSLNCSNPALRFVARS
jgi:hypothetical protein